MSRRIRTATSADHGPLVDLLEAADLPTEGLSPSLQGFLVAEEDGRIVGAVGLEVYGDTALLRSAVVASDRRGSGLGAELVGRALAHARTQRVREVFLLTTTAQHFFPRFGFAVVPREAVAQAVRASAEFRGACPDSAIAMRKVM